MSDAGGGGEGGGGVALADIDITLSVLDQSWATEYLAALDNASTVADIVGDLGRMSDAVEAQVRAGTLTPAVAANVDELIAGVGRATQLRILAPDQVGAYLAWLPKHPGKLVAVPGTPLDQAVIATAVAYSAANPHPTRPTPPKPKPVRPTPGQKAVTAAARNIHTRTVPGGGLDKAQSAAVSKAIGIAYSDMLRAQAAVIDEYFGPITPGELPQALTDLFRADSILSHQVARLADEVGGKAPGHVAGALHGVQEALHGLEQEVHLQAEQLAETRPSTLHTHVQDNTKLIDHLGTRVNHIGSSVIPALAAGLTVVDRNLSGLNHLTAGISSGNLQHDLNTLTQEVRSKVEPAIQTLEDCCAENRAVTNPIREGAATPSLLRHLGSLLGKAFAIGWVATLAETALTVLDARLVVTDIAADTATVTDWAISAASVIESDLGWLGGLRVGA